MIEIFVGAIKSPVLKGFPCFCSVPHVSKTSLQLRPHIVKYYFLPLCLFSVYSLQVSEKPQLSRQASTASFTVFSLINLPSYRSKGKCQSAVFFSKIYYQFFLVIGLAFGLRNGGSQRMHISVYSDIKKQSPRSSRLTYVMDIMWRISEKYVYLEWLTSSYSTNRKRMPPRGKPFICQYRSQFIFRKDNLLQCSRTRSRRVKAKIHYSI